MLSFMETSREAIAMVFRVSLLFSSIPSFPLGSHRRKKPTSHSWEMMMMMGLVMASTKDLLCYCLQICSNLWSLLLPYESSCCLVRTSKSKYLPKSFLFGSAAVEIVSNMLEFFLVYALLSTITTKVSIEEEGGTKERQQQIT